MHFKELEGVAVDADFENYLPSHKDDEHRMLAERLKAEGCRAGAIVVADIDGRRLLLDGHNTLAICRDLDIELCKPVVQTFKTREEAKAWMRGNQLSRRNLTDNERAYYMGEELIARKKSRGGDRRSETAVNENVTATIASENGVTERTAHRAAAFAGAVNRIREEDRDAAAAILSGDSELTRDEVIRAAKALDELPDSPGVLAEEGDNLVATPSVVDDDGVAVPEALVPVFRDSALFKQAALACVKAATLLEQVEETPGFKAFVTFNRHIPGTDRKLYSTYCRIAASLLKAIRPAKTCSACGGTPNNPDNDPCKVCEGLTFLTAQGVLGNVK